MSKNSSHSEWYAPLMQGFVDRVRRGDAGTEPLEEALYVARVISRAYESSEQGRALPLVPDGAGAARGPGPLRGERRRVECRRAAGGATPWSRRRSRRRAARPG